MPGPALTPIANPLPVAPAKGPEGSRPDAASPGREADAPDTGFAGELQRRMQGEAGSQADTAAGQQDLARRCRKDAFAQGPFDAQCVTAAQALHFFCALADQAVNDGDMTRFGIGIDDAKRPAQKGLSPIAMDIDKLAGLRFPGNLRCMEYHFPYFRNNGFILDDSRHFQEFLHLLIILPLFAIRTVLLYHRTADFRSQNQCCRFLTISRRIFSILS